MSWPLPTPEDLVDRAAGVIEARLPGLNPRSENTVEGILVRGWVMAVYALWLHHQRLAAELLPDTAEDWLERHASIWNITRLPATRSSGLARVEGAEDLAVPAEIVLRSPSGILFTSEAGGTIDGGVLDLPLFADDPGSAGNLPAGTVLQLVSPVLGLTQQSAVVQAPGLTGGQDEEELEALRARLLQRIREPPAGGSRSDYDAWARRATGVAYVAVKPLWMGAGTVGVIVAMEGATAALPGDIDRVGAEIEVVRPVTANVFVVAATLLPSPFTIRLSPDTTATRAAVQAALQQHFLREAQIGVEMPLSRISEAISAAAGEYSHEILSPTGPIEPDETELPVLGAITWSA